MSLHHPRILRSGLPTVVLLAATAVGSSVVAGAGAVPVQPRLAMGDTFSVLLKPDGSLFAWGGNTYGQLGLGASISARTRPARVGTDSD